MKLGLSPSSNKAIRRRFTQLVVALVRVVVAETRSQPESTSAVAQGQEAVAASRCELRRRLAVVLEPAVEAESRSESERKLYCDYCISL